MKIGIDGSVFIYGQNTGVTKSVSEIIRNWAIKYPENEYFIISRLPIDINFDLPSNWHKITSLENKKKLFNIEAHGKIWNIIKLPWIIKKYDIDAFWGTNYILPLFTSKRVKCFVTVYDLALFIFKGIGERSNLVKLKLFAKKSCQKADTIIAISKATAKDVETIFNIDKSKICVSYCGSPNDKIDFGINEVKDILKFEEQFYLFISTIEPRKNIITIVKAFEEYIDRTGNNRKLVIAGKRGWNCEDIYTIIEKSKYRNKIVLPGYISEQDKGFLFNNATAFIYPSLYEGFGLPSLEAFRYELPVITTNVSSLPEVGGDAALYINDPYDYKDLAQKMMYLDNISYEEKRKMNEEMKMQLDKFSWDKNAEEMMDIIAS